MQMTPQELEENEMFEDDPRGTKEIEYGRVVKSHYDLCHEKKGDVFDD